MNRSEDLEQWAKGQTRITNKQIRDRFDVDEDNEKWYWNNYRIAGKVE